MQMTCKWHANEMQMTCKWHANEMRMIFTCGFRSYCQDVNTATGIRPSAVPTPSDRTATTPTSTRPAVVSVPVREATSRVVNTGTRPPIVRPSPGIDVTPVTCPFAARHVPSFKFNRLSQVNIWAIFNPAFLIFVLRIPISSHYPVVAVLCTQCIETMAPLNSVNVEFLYCNVM